MGDTMGWGPNGPGTQWDGGHIGMGTKWARDTSGWGPNGPGTQWDGDTMGQGHSGMGDPMGQGHNGMGDTMGQGHNGMGTQWAKDTMGWGPNGPGTQWARDTTGWGHNGHMDVLHANPRKTNSANFVPSSVDENTPKRRSSVSYELRMVKL